MIIIQLIGPEDSLGLIVSKMYNLYNGDSLQQVI